MIISSRLIPAVAAILSISCATTKPRPPQVEAAAAVTACRTTVTTDGVEGIVRHVGGDPARQLWDIDGDGDIEYELRRTLDDRGRVTRLERALADGTVVERVAREWNGARLEAEVGDAFDAKGHAVADGAPDWRRDLVYDGDRLVEERIDQRDAAMLPGIDGTPEFRIVWKHESGHPVSATRFRGERPVATVVNVWRGALLAETRTDFGDDGTIDHVETHTYDERGRLVTSASKGPDGARTLRYAYCD